MIVKSSFICPFCFEKHPMSELKFKCINKRCPGATEPENGTRNEDGYYFKSPSSIVKDSRIACDKCGQMTGTIVCPSCNNKLPESTLHGKDMIISIVGARGSGKSNYVGVLINELINRIAPRFEGSMIGFDDTLHRYRSGLYRDLYEDFRAPDQTSTFLNNGVEKPLIFTLQFVKKTLFKKKINSFTLVFFDTAGEDLNDLSNMSTVNKYIYQSSGIIFLQDPMQITTITNKLDDDTVARASSFADDSGNGSDDVMSRVSELIRTNKGLRNTRLIDIPVAVVFSKLDAIANLIPSGSSILELSPHCNHALFDNDDLSNVNGEIRGLLSEWDAQAFISQAENNYSNVAFFGASALGMGNNPEKRERKIQRPRPHRIEDAILWILKENGVIKSSK